jgi:uncharacterized hydrophobic protein (TIGR00341 family)
MRQIQIVVHDSEVADYLELISAYDPNPLHTKATGPYDTIIIRIEEEKIDEIIELLKNAGLEDSGSIFIMPPAVSITRKGDAAKPKKTIAPSVELSAQATETSEMTRGFVYMTMISAFVATLGLLLNSTAAVIGAMVIAPLLGPSISICVGTVLGDGRLFRSAMFNVFIGLILAIAVSIITAWITLRSGLIAPLLDIEAGLPKEILERTNLNVLNIGLALASGAAGAYSFAEGKGEALIGVMVAVALMPPACVAGIGLALGDIGIFTGASLLLLVNVICINIAGTLVLWKAGVRPTKIFKEIESKRRVKKRVATTAAILIVLGMFFAYSTYEAYSDLQLKDDIKDHIAIFVEGLDNVTGVEVSQVEIYANTVEVKAILRLDPNCTLVDYAVMLKDSLEAEFDDVDYEFEVTVVIERSQMS